MNEQPDLSTQKRIESLINIAKSVSEPVSPLFSELPKNFIIEQIPNTQTYKIWSNQSDKQRYSDGAYKVAVDANGRMVKRLNNMLSRMETWEYDEQGYNTNHSVRFINNSPSGWSRTFRYSENEVDRQLTELVYQRFQTPAEDALPISSQDGVNPLLQDFEVEQGLEIHTQQDENQAMLTAYNTGAYLVRSTFDLHSATSDLIQVGNDVTVQFVSMQPQSAEFVGDTLNSQ